HVERRRDRDALGEQRLVQQAVAHGAEAENRDCRHPIPERSLRPFSPIISLTPLNAMQAVGQAHAAVLASATMRVAIIEPYATGHRMDYVRYMLEGLREVSGLRATLVTTATATEHPNFRSVVRDFADLVDVEVMPLDYGAQRWMRACGSFAHEQAVIARG